MRAVHSSDEQLRLDECSLEPIRTPGRIQSHGILLGVDLPSQRVSLASENAAGLLGRHVADLGSQQLVEAVERGVFPDPIRLELAGFVRDAIMHPLGDRLIIELEPAQTSLEYARTSVVGAIHRLAGIDDPDVLRQAVADEIRAISGYDRVLVYQFHDDDHGEVVAEARAEHLEPYLGLHFPASDIPAQARGLYLTKLSRAIVNTEDPGSPLVALDDESARDLDLSQAELRAVSVHHLQYMRNMGQVSTVSLSLLSGGRLAGMITLAHGTERRLPVLLRRALEVLATQLQSQLDASGRIAQLTRALDVRTRRAALLAPMFGGRDVLAALLDGPATVLDLVAADGVLIRSGDEVRSAGDVPAADPKALLDALGPDALVTDAIGVDRPDLVEPFAGFAGAVVVPLGDLDRIAFLRREVAQNVTWLGDQSPTNRDTPLSPRNSFSAWKEDVHGTSMAWGGVADEIADLGRELADALERRTAARLAELAMRDPLTGVRNRRFLFETVRRAQDGGRVVFFLDLDDFKGVNDELGHDVGDGVLVEVARRLEEASRAEDIVARLGGDEFVVVAEGLDEGTAVSVGERLVAAISGPISVGERTITVTASCGIAMSSPDATGDRLIELADEAMYRAKRGGRNRASR